MGGFSSVEVGSELECSRAQARKRNGATYLSNLLAERRVGAFAYDKSN